MKKFGLLLTIMVLASFCVQVAAQERQLLTVAVPFSFTAENTEFAAGSYKVYLLNPYNKLRVENADGKSVMVSGSPQRMNSDATRGGFVFQRIAGQYFLVEVREQGSSVQRGLPLGSHARELAKKNSNPHQLDTMVMLPSH